MLRNIRMIVAYDGADFHGWQRQPEVRTVQECLEAAVRRVVRHPTDLIGAGRTDAGVHARGQVANFKTDCSIPVRNLHHAIGHRIPKDMTIDHLDEAPLAFHAQHSAKSKCYRYRVYNASRRPVAELLQRYAYHCWFPLDLERLRAAAAVLVGKHDFSAFASAGNVRTHNVRTITRIAVFRAGYEVQLDVEGDGFLYNQVRNMVGTLIEVGRGHWPVEQMVEILAGRDRRLAGPTAPAAGLCLQWVRYDLPELRRIDAARRTLDDSPEHDSASSNPDAPRRSAPR
ncbi:MAG: tRNA pseudouridine(38-40) synthase TruA [Phycisphaerae bacterium]